MVFRSDPRYPDDIAEAFFKAGRIDGVVPAFVRPGDMDRISVEIDFLGLNYYTTTSIREGSEETDVPDRPPATIQPDGFTEMGWATDLDGLRWYLEELNDRYAPQSIVVLPK